MAVVFCEGSLRICCSWVSWVGWPGAALRLVVRHWAASPAHAHTLTLQSLVSQVPTRTLRTVQMWRSLSAASTRTTWSRCSGSRCVCIRLTCRVTHRRALVVAVLLPVSASVNSTCHPCHLPRATGTSTLPQAFFEKNYAGQVRGRAALRARTASLACLSRDGHNCPRPGCDSGQASGESCSP